MLTENQKNKINKTSILLRNWEVKTKRAVAFEERELEEVNRGLLSFHATLVEL